MRWIFFSLVLANIGFYIWHSVESSRQDRLARLNASSSVVQGTMMGRPLTLASELGNEERITLVKQQRKKKTVKPKPPVIPIKKIGIAPKITLEEKAKQSEGADGENVEPQKPVIAAVVPNQCVMVGPVSGTQFNQVSQRLLALAIVSELRKVKAAGKTEYWVVLPPFKDEKSAVRKLQELQGRGLSAQILPGGELTNAIAFGEGVFSDKEAAQKLANKLSGKGVKVEVRDLPQVRVEKWISLSERQAPKLNDKLWQKLQKDFPNLNKKVYRCR